MQQEKITINEITSLWQRDKRQYVKTSTHAAYMLIAESHLRPAFGTMTSISEAAVQDFVIEKLASGLSQKYVKDMLIVLRMIVRYGEKHYGLPHNEWEIHYPTASERVCIPVLSVADHRKILAHIRDNFNFRGLGIYIALTTGLRIGEICGLKWSDIDLVEDVLTVRRTVGRIYMIDDDGCRHTELSISTPKTVKAMREIPLNRRLLAILRPLKKIVNPDFYVISNEPKPIEPRTYRNFYHEFLTSTGIQPIKFHGLRHSFATRCIESNCDYKTVSEILGHTNISTTLNLYVHPGKEQKKKCIDKMLRCL